MKKLYIYTILLAALTVVSCDLTRINPNETPIESAKTDLEKARYMLDGCYAALQSGFLYKGGQESNGVRDHDILSDCAYNNWATGLGVINNGEHDATSNIIEGFWKANYNGVARCNLFLETYRDMEILGKERMMAEAKYLRALFYFNLTNYYGNVPLLLETMTPEEAYYVTRTPRSETLDTITNDLLWALDHLPYRQAQSLSDRYQASKGAALGLLTRLYLHRASHLNEYTPYAAEWEGLTGEKAEWVKAEPYYIAARDAALRLMSDEFDYELNSNYASLFDGTQENGVESLFEVQFTSGVGEGEAFSGTYAKNPQPWIVPTAECALTFQTKAGGNLTEIPVQETLLNDMDPRFYTTMITTGQTWIGAEWIGGGINYNTGDPYTKFALCKYVRTTTGQFMDGDRNFMVIRYADILLMFAEAKIELGEIDGAMFDAIDAVRDRVNMPLSDRSMDQGVLLDEIKKERLRELAMEGLRYQDYMRWGLYPEIFARVPTAGYVADFPIRRMLWPVPQTECDNNRSEEGLQNPGWK